ncbi:MAG: copper-containing nitrite reductase [Pseudomonadales bacterium]|nr:copper-containing nitrite reductase [Pseudomonadales bacterium]NRA18390.1 nitrite reductase, copper-containing [Oceanospirillaceae bacterium]
MKIFIKCAIVAALLFTTASQANESAYEISNEFQGANLKVVTQTLVAPPAFPEHKQVVTENKIVQVRLVIEEKEVEVSPGVFMWQMTFNGTAPGPMIVAHEGDYIEMTLVNPSTNMLMHNIDLHAFTGAMGGGALTEIMPGQEVTVRFKATKVGTFVYHCAPGGIMIPWHVVSGMNGAITILPKDGLKDKAGNSITYDKAFYIGGQDFYLPKDKKGKYKRYPNSVSGMADTLEVMKTLLPSHLPFNGVMNAMTGSNALTAKVGETVLIVHSQANRQAYPHLIGGHGDYVWETGSFNDAPATDQETWSIAAGAAGAAIYTFEQPGTYAYVSHNLIEAIMMGSIAHFKVEGKWNNDLQEQVSAPGKIK